MKSPIVCLLMTVVLVSCSGAGNKSPIVPSGSAQVGGVDENHHLWGYWDVQVGADHRTFDIIPIRSTQLHLNAVRLLEETPCKDCLKVQNVKTVGTTGLQADLVLTHPYPGKDKYTGFDVRGVFITESDFTFPASGRSVALGDTIPHLLNADGYTSLFNPAEYPETNPGPPALRYIPGHHAPGGNLTATLNPYIAYMKSSPRRMFPAGGSESRTVNLEVPTGKLEFGYAIDVCWTLVDKVTDPLTDFPPDANCLEAYSISASAQSFMPGVVSAAPVEVEVFDHQGLGTISSVEVEAPSLFNGFVSLAYSTATGDESYLFSGTLENQLSTAIGEYPMLMRVTDTQDDPNLGPIRAWEVGSVKVISSPGPDHAVAIAIAEPCIQKPGKPIHFKNYGSYDSTGADIAKYEWDWDNDGTFDEEGSDTWHTWSDYGTYYVQFRVTSSSGLTDVLDEPLKITIRDKNGWVVTVGGAGYCVAMGLAVDNLGNVYVAGYFIETVDFDPGIGIDNHTSNGKDDIFLCKFSSDLDLLWARTWGGDQEDGFIVAVDTDNAGGIYVAGNYQNSVDFDPGPGSEVRSADTGSQFLSKFDSDGNFKWVRVWGNVMAEQVLCNVNGDVIVKGIFAGKCDFDPGPGDACLDAGVKIGDSVSCFDKDGNFKWVQGWWGSDGKWTSCGHNLRCDNAGNIYVHDDFYGNVDLDPGPDANETSGFGTYLSKLDAGGAYQWAVWWLFIYGQGLAVHSSGRPVATGSFEGTIDFDPGLGVDERTPAGDSDIYFVSMGVGGAYQGAVTLGANGPDSASDACYDTADNLFVAGSFTGTVDFDPGPGEFWRTAKSDHGGYLLKMNSSQKLEWVQAWGSAWPYLVDFSPNGRIYVAGGFKDQADFYPGSDEEIHTSEGQTDFFIMMFPPDGQW